MGENPCSASPQQLHIVLFPFMSKGHTIPLLHLTKLIHNHRPQATFTMFTTPANEPFVSASLSSLPPTNITVLSLPLSISDERIPPGVESTDQLPSMSLFHSFALATKALQPHFEAALESIQNGRHPITLLISDGFLYWIHESTAKFDFRRLAFSGMNLYASAVCISVMLNSVFSGVESDDKPIHVPDFPWITVRKDDFEESFHVSDPDDPIADFNSKCFAAIATTHGFVVNSCVEIEQPFLDYVNSLPHPKCLCVGPLCLAETPAQLESLEKPDWIKWLDAKLGEGKSVLYVAFGSQAEITSEQLEEIMIGLEKSGVNFLWVLRMKSNQTEIMSGFEDRVKDKGMVVRSWVNQREILEHQSVSGFLSHCGWNSAIESICAGVPILAWPMMAEQHLNVKLVVEEMEVGLRVETCDGSRIGFVKWEGLSKMIKVLMEEDMGKKVRKNVEELSEVVKKCVEEGGSSWCNLESLLDELEMGQKSNKGCGGQMINGHGSTNNNI